jgi:hypothetical protein
VPARASEREFREIDDCLRRVRAGETAAFEPVVRRFQRPLRAWLAMRAPPGVDADEVLSGGRAVATHTRLRLNSLTALGFKLIGMSVRRRAEIHLRVACLRVYG